MENDDTPEDIFLFDEAIIPEIPERYVNQWLAIKKVYLSEFITFFITKKFEFIEVNEHLEIINYIKLDISTNSDYRSDDFADSVKLKVFERLDYKLIILIHISDKLYVINWKKSEIRIFKIINEVIKFKYEGQSTKQNNPAIVVNFKNGTSERLSVCDAEYDRQICENNIAVFGAIDSNIQYQKICMNKALVNVINDQKLKIFSLIGRQKFLPSIMRSSDPNDVSPLVRFGSIFSRVTNKLIIGIPVFNASLERRLLLENLKLIFYCPTLPSGIFQYDLYKMKTDCPSFEEFEKLFNEQFEFGDGDEQLAERPDFKGEWRKCCEKSVLYACEAGVFVVIVDIVQFVNDMNHTIGFNISYEIEGRLMNSKLIGNLGRLMIDSKLIYSSQLDVNQYNLEKYRNLLAITSTSQIIASVEISFEKNERIENFFVKILNFEIVKSKEDMEVEHPTSYFENLNTETVSLRLKQDYFLQSSNGYYEGMLIRVRLESDELMKAKIYARATHQIINLLKAIYKQYPRHCKIKLRNIF